MLVRRRFRRRKVKKKKIIKCMLGGVVLLFVNEGQTRVTF